MFGSHTSAAGGVEKVFERAKQIGATALQFFARPRLTWKAPNPVSDETARAFASERERCGFSARSTCVHAGYLLNMATSDPRIAGLTREALCDELRRCNSLGVPTIVVHPGSCPSEDAAAGRARVAETVAFALNEAGGSVKIALELMAGAGSQLGSSVQDLAAVHALLSRGLADRVGVCVDSAHAFAAGYDLRKEGVAAEVVRHITEDAGGLLCVHANDSASPLGSHVDRHANIGFGEIGQVGLWRLLSNQLVRDADVPIVLETPPSGKISSAAEIALLRSLACGPMPTQQDKKRKKKRAKEEEPAPERKRKS